MKKTANPQMRLGFMGAMDKASRNKAIMSALTRAAQAVGVGAGIGLAGSFVDKMMEYFREKKLQSKSVEYYTKMMEAHPQLKKEDPETVAQYWASLFHFAPHMAQDPLAAGAYIRQSIARGYGEEFGGPPPDTFNTLSDINKKLVETAAKERRSGAGTALRNVLTSTLADGSI